MSPSSRPTRTIVIDYELAGEVVASVEVRCEDDLRWYANVRVTDSAGSLLHVTRAHGSSHDAIVEAEEFIRARCGPAVVSRR